MYMYPCPETEVANAIATIKGKNFILTKYISGLRRLDVSEKLL
jgi:hypothetical protein